MKVWIREALVPKLLKNADKLIKRANKIGAEPITITPTGETKLDYSAFKRGSLSNGWDDDVRFARINGRPFVGIPYIEMEIEGIMPVIQGWEFFAKINHMGKDKENGEYLNIIETSPFIGQQAEFESSIQEHQGCAPNCQHCDTVRRRNTTFLLRNIETQEIKQVGSTCVDDFLDDDTLSKALFHFNLNKLFDEIDEYEGDYDYGRGQCRYHIEPVMALACYFIKEYGFAKSDEEPSTKQRVMNHLMRSGKKFDDEALKILYDYAAEMENPYLNEAKEIIQETLNNPSKNNYIHNAKVIMKTGYVDIMTGSALGIAVSLPKDFYTNKAKADLTFKEEFFGKEKDRGILKLKLLEKYDRYDTAYPYTSYSFVDDSGLRFSAKSYFQSYIEMDIGKTYTMKATVKGHYTHDDGRKSTNITRISELEEVSPDIPTPEFKAPKKTRAKKKTADAGLGM
ncbi:hypothetical protein [Vibrio parahaemolyticus]|uniref:hypothetical protein n=1 Tax=Vibrio parahaemolyticus TaxID=670 RepID=UPI003D7D58EE